MKLDVRTILGAKRCWLIYHQSQLYRAPVLFQYVTWSIHVLCQRNNVRQLHVLYDIKISGTTLSCVLVCLNIIEQDVKW